MNYFPASLPHYGQVLVVQKTKSNKIRKNESVFTMRRTTLSIGLSVCITALLNACWHDATKLPKLRATQYCFSLGKDYGTRISSNGFYSFHYPVDSLSNLSGKSKTANYSENFILYSGGELYTFLSTDSTYGLWGSYYIDGDIVKAQFYPAPINVAGFREEVWFRLIEPNRLVIIGRAWNKPLNNTDLEKYQHHNPDAKGRFSRFIERREVPNPDDSWLKKRKWFWCNKEEYLMWKKYRNKKI